MVLSAEEVSSAAENHLLNAIEQLSIDACGLQELFRTKKAAASACETKYSDALDHLRKQVAELEAGRDSAAEALANERSQNEEKFAEKLEAAIVARLPTIFDTHLRNLISDEELAASQPLPRVALLHEARESVLKNSVALEAAPRLRKQDMYPAPATASFLIESISFEPGDEASTAILRSEIEAQLAVADQKPYLDLLDDYTTRLLVSLSGRATWFRVSRHKFLKLDGCETYVVDRDSNVLFLPWGWQVAEWKNLPAGTMLLKQGANGDELVIKLGGNGSEGSPDGLPKLVCVKTLWVLDIQEKQLGFLKGGNIQEGLDTFAKECGGEAGEIKIRNLIEMQFVMHAFCLYSIQTDEVPDRKLN
jgi:hypothetical protein